MNTGTRNFVGVLAMILTMLSTSLYALLYKQSSQWVRYVKGVLDECGLSYIRHNKPFTSISCLKRQVFHCLFDQFTQSWKSDVFASPKCFNYRIFKERLQIENYV